jgi:hypothetical protein
MQYECGRRDMPVGLRWGSLKERDVVNLGVVWRIILKWIINSRIEGVDCWGRLINLRVS